ncbi:MAG: general secretion pathway protein GspB [bacterium]|nr:hypothetical protein [Gammaproteobacteria bacterium]HIL97372.1 hypothetical protein [Pseudomonadales bacterium]
MSYILDALNKSEQERQSKTTPDLSSVHRRPPTKASPSRWLLTLIVLAVVNTMGLWLFWVNQDSTTIVSSENTASAADSLEQTANLQLPLFGSPTHETPKDQYSAPRDAMNEERESLSLLITPTGTSPIYAESQPVNISELPRNVQRQIPDLQFSSHLFSDDRSFRMVNINGNMLREGEYINDELRLEEITTDGVILNYQHYTFEISILRDWRYN